MKTVWLLFGSLSLFTPAMAHEPYTGTIDPVTTGSCCGGTDCAILSITKTMLTPAENGYRLVLSAAEAAKINPYRTTPIDTVIPWERVQPSWDGQFHLCVPSHRNTSMKADFYCFWAPPNT